jgi:hypothetical protein
MFLVGNRHMSPLPEFPRAALAAGLPARFLYWFGRSGQRYLFSCTGLSGAADFESGVAIAVSGTEVIWSGEIAELLGLPNEAPAKRGAIYVHLLASTRAARRAIVEDLCPAAQVEFRLAA